jgi:hypothetical protein
MTTSLSRPAPVMLMGSKLFLESVKSWGRWGSDDELGTVEIVGGSAVFDGATRQRRTRGRCSTLRPRTLRQPRRHRTQEVKKIGPSIAE